jgi:hypothetical protein
MGVNGSRRVAASYPFSSPDQGIAGPGSIAYPIDLECGTARQHGAEVQAWIYDTAGRISQPVTISLACPRTPAVIPLVRQGKLAHAETIYPENGTTRMQLRVRPLLLPCLIWQK